MYSLYNADHHRRYWHYSSRSPMSRYEFLLALDTKLLPRRITSRIILAELRKPDQHDGYSICLVPIDLNRRSTGRRAVDCFMRQIEHNYSLTGKYDLYMYSSQRNSDKLIMRYPIEIEADSSNRSVGIV